VSRDTSAGKAFGFLARPWRSKCPKTGGRAHTFAGEETALLKFVEGRPRRGRRSKPPFPAQSGDRVARHVNNVEDDLGILPP